MERRIGLIDVPWLVTGSQSRANLLGGKPKKEEILRAHLFTDFNVGAVQGADREGTVHAELHVAGAGGFFAGSRNLLTEIGAGINYLAKADIVVRDKDDPQPLFHVGIMVYHITDRVDELDDQLGHEVSGSRFSAEDESTGRHVEVGIVLEPMVESENMKH